MKIAIVGYRNYTDYERFCFIMKEFNVKNASMIISGGAPGIDSLAERWALENGFRKRIDPNEIIEKELLIYPAEWNKYGKAAGPIRNKFIVDKMDIMIAIPSPTSTGTYNSISLAKQAGKTCYIVSNFK